MRGTGKEGKPMELAEIKENLNRRVRVKTRHTDADYILTGCVIRKNEKGDFFYQAEVQDMKNHRSVLVTGLEDVNPEEEQESCKQALKKVSQAIKEAGENL